MTNHGPLPCPARQAVMPFRHEAVPRPSRWGDWSQWSAAHRDAGFAGSKSRRCGGPQGSLKRRQSLLGSALRIHGVHCLLLRFLGSGAEGACNKAWVFLLAGAPPQPQPSTRRRNSDAGKNQEKVEQAEEDGQESNVITGVLLFIAFHAPIPARVRSNAFTPTCCGSRRRGKFRKLQKDGVDFAHQLSEVFRVITLAALSHGFRHNCPDDQIDEVGDVTDTRVWTQSSLNAELPQKAAKERRHPQIR